LKIWSLAKKTSTEKETCREGESATGFFILESEKVKMYKSEKVG
jgi:hypothetical protein